MKNTKKILKNNSINSLYNKVKKDLKWINLNYGQGIVFKSYAWEYYKQRKARDEFNCRFEQFFHLTDKEIKVLSITIKPITL